MKTRIMALTHSPTALFGAVALAALSLVFLFSALSAKAVVGPTVATTIHNSSHATTTLAPIGSAVHANAVVATSTSTTTPTGTVDFKRYENTSCSGAPTTQAGVALAGGEAESEAATVPAEGLSYLVHYSGDTQNAPSEGSCVTLTPTAPNTTLSTALSTSTVLVGASVHDSAALNNETANASGTVAYTVYTNSSCSAGAQGAGTKSVSDGSVPNSDSIIFDTPGVFYWQAVYSGDSQNTAATSSCQSEVLRVLATSTDEDSGDDNDDNDNDNGEHKGFFEGLPFGIFKKIFSDKDFPIPPGIKERFLNGDFFNKFFHHDNSDDNNDNNSDNNRGRTERGKNGQR